MKMEIQLPSATIRCEFVEAFYSVLSSQRPAELDDQLDEEVIDALLTIQEGVLKLCMLGISNIEHTKDVLNVQKTIFN